MKKLWFKSKLYGWGWVPCSWEGWLTLGIFIVLYASVLAAGLHFASNQREALLYAVLPASILLALLLFISYVKGETPRWRWGK